MWQLLDVIRLCWTAKQTVTVAHDKACYQSHLKKDGSSRAKAMVLSRTISFLNVSLQGKMFIQTDEECVVYDSL